VSELQKSKGAWVEMNNRLFAMVFTVLSFIFFGIVVTLFFRAYEIAASIPNAFVVFGAEKPLEKLTVLNFYFTLDVFLMFIMYVFAMACYGTAKEAYGFWKKIKELKKIA